MDVYIGLFLLTGVLIEATGVAVLLNIQAAAYVVAGLIMLGHRGIRRFRAEPGSRLATVEGCHISSPPATST
jgi:hypothetical protein